MRLLVHGLAGYTKGGIETFVLGMAAHMSDDITFDYIIEDDGTKTIMPGLGDTLFIAPKRRMIANLISWKKLLIERKREDSGIYFNWYSMAWIFPAIIARNLGYKVIIHAHNNDLHNCSILQRLMHQINRQFQKVMKITRFTNSDLSTKFFFGDKSADLIFNAIDVNKFAFCEEKRKQVREDLNLKNKHVYGFAGRLSFQKNPLFLIDIFAEIKNLDDAAAFIVCGNGELFEETKKRAEINNIDVLFLGSVSNINDYYNAMDLFLLPSRFEGLGIVLIEAQCCGLPCLASEGVIPLEAKQSDLLEFISLDSGEKKWAQKSIELANRVYSRKQYSSLLKGTRFDIDVESKILQDKLLDTCLSEKTNK